MPKSILLKTIITLIVLILFCSSCSAPQQQEDVITEKEAKALLDRYMETVTNADVDLIDEIIAPEFVLRSPLLPQPIEGKENYKIFVTNSANTFSELKATIEEVIVHGDEIWGRFSLEGVNTGPLGNLPATGRKFKITGLAVTRVADGMIVADETYWNVLDFYQQLGFTLTPPQGSAEEWMYGRFLPLIYWKYSKLPKPRMLAE